jgi:hypothetical protein
LPSSEGSIIGGEARLTFVAVDAALIIWVFSDAPWYWYYGVSARRHWRCNLGTSGGNCQEEDRLKEVHLEVKRHSTAEVFEKRQYSGGF